MANGILINYAGPPQEISSLFPDNGLAALAASIKKAGHGVQIWDYSTVGTIRAIYTPEIRKKLIEISPLAHGGTMPTQEEIQRFFALEEEVQQSEVDFLDGEILKIERYISKNNISWIGFKLWMNGMPQSMMIASKLKKRFPDLQIFGGGPNIDIFRDSILKKNPYMDVLVFSEADQAVPEILHSFDNGSEFSNISSIYYRDEEGNILSTPNQRFPDLNDLPYPLYDNEIYPAMDGHQKMKILCFDESRGCPMGCSFCVDVKKYDKQRIEKSAKRCFQEISHLNTTLGVSYFRFSGSNTSPNLMKHFAEEVLDSNLNITFSLFSSTIGLRPETIKRLREAGLFGIFIGVESAHEETRKKHLGKSYSFKKLKDVISECKQNGIFLTLSMIHPTPFIDKEIEEENFEFLIESLSDYPHSTANICPPGLYPHSGWFDDMEKYGFSLLCNSKEEYIEEVHKFKYHMCLPRALWKDLPYSLNGKTFKEILKETNRFAVRLRERHILPYFLEANMMMMKPLGFTSVHEFARASEAAFFTGDADLLESWNETFNTKTVNLKKTND